MKKIESKIKCFKCKAIPKEFLMLYCNHVICLNCKDKIIEKQKHNQNYIILCDCQK